MVEHEPECDAEPDDHGPTKARILSSLSWLDCTSREIGETAIADDIKALVARHEDPGEESG